MKPPLNRAGKMARTAIFTRSRGKSRRGVSLVELAISMAILSITAGGVLAALIHSQKVAQSNLAQSYAESTAQSIMEQLVRLPEGVISETSNTTVSIMIPYVNSDDKTTIEVIDLPWATDDTFTDLGPPSEPGKGVLVDATYIADGHVIRPERYMKFRANLRRTIEASEHRTTIMLRYQWEVPDRKGPGNTPIYLAGQLTSARSTAASF